MDATLASDLLMDVMRKKIAALEAEVTYLQSEVALLQSRVDAAPRKFGTDTEFGSAFGHGCKPTFGHGFRPKLTSVTPTNGFTPLVAPKTRFESPTNGFKPSLLPSPVFAPGGGEFRPAFPQYN